MICMFPTLPQGYTFVNELCGSILGRTAIAVQESTRENCVVKCVPRSRLGNTEQTAVFLDTIRRSMSVRTKFIVPFREIIETDEFVFLVRPFVDCVNLADQLALNQGTDLNYYFVVWKVLLRTLQQLHQARVVPNFIRPCNIFLTKENEPILVDIYPPVQDVCRKHQSPFSVCFLAPEFFTGEPPGSEASDIWSLSVIFLYMMTGQIPWTSQNLFKMIQQIMKGHEGVVIRIPDEIREIIMRTLIVDPTKRADLAWLMTQTPMVSAIKRGSAGRTNHLRSQKSTIIKGSVFAAPKIQTRKSMAMLPDVGELMKAEVAAAKAEARDHDEFHF